MLWYTGLQPVYPAWFVPRWDGHLPVGRTAKMAMFLQTDERAGKRLRLHLAAGIDCAAPACATRRFPNDGFASRRTDDRASAIWRAKDVFAAGRSPRVKRYARAGSAAIL